MHYLSEHDDNGEERPHPIQIMPVAEPWFAIFASDDGGVYCERLIAWGLFTYPDDPKYNQIGGLFASDCVYRCDEITNFLGYCSEVEWGESREHWESLSAVLRRSRTKEQAL